MSSTNHGSRWCPSPARTSPTTAELTNRNWSCYLRDSIILDTVDKSDIMICESYRSWLLYINGANGSSDTLTTVREESLDVEFCVSWGRLSTTVTFVIQEQSKNTFWIRDLAASLSLDCNIMMRGGKAKRRRSDDFQTVGQDLRWSLGPRLKKVYKPPTETLSWEQLDLELLPSGGLLFLSIAIRTWSYCVWSATYLHETSP